MIPNKKEIKATQAALYDLLNDQSAANGKITVTLTYAQAVVLTMYCERGHHNLPVYLEDRIQTSQEISTGVACLLQLTIASKYDQEVLEVLKNQVLCPEVKAFMDQTVDLLGTALLDKLSIPRKGGPDVAVDQGE